jgi:hypoxanthine phosphoribosyltransferase
MSRCIVIPDDVEPYPVDLFSVPSHYRECIESILIPDGLIRSRAARLAEDIAAAYPDTSIHLLCVLKGAASFCYMLMNELKRIQQCREADHALFTFDFVRVSSYVGTESTGVVSIRGANLTELKGRDVLVCEDIIDTSATIQKLLPELAKYEPSSVKVVSLLEKRTPKNVDGIVADFVGFQIPDLFIVGCGLDLDEVRTTQQSARGGRGRGGDTCALFPRQ